MTSIIGDISIASLSVGTKVVFHQRGAYCNNSYIFGMIVEYRKKRWIQLVDILYEQLNNDPITIYTKVTPQWNKLTCKYPISIGKGKNEGMVWLRGYEEYCRPEDTYLFYDVYDERIEYKDCHDMP